MWIDRVAMTIEQVPDEELDGRIAELARKARLLALPLSRTAPGAARVAELLSGQRAGRFEPYKEALDPSLKPAPDIAADVYGCKPRRQNRGRGAYEVALHLTGQLSGLVAR